MTIPGTQGAAAVFGGSGVNPDEIDFERNLLPSIKRKRRFEQFQQSNPNPIDPAGVYSSPNAARLQQAEVMRDIMPSEELAGGIMNNPLDPRNAQPQQPTGVGAGPNPIGATTQDFKYGVNGGTVGAIPNPNSGPPGRILPLGTPPPPPPMESPIARAMRETPKPQPRGVGGRVKDALLSIPYTLATGGGLEGIIPNAIRGASGDLREQEWRRNVGEKEALYSKEDAYRRQGEGEQMKKNEYNLDVRKQGETERQNERMYGAKMSDLERRATESETRARQSEERQLLNQQKFEETIRQYEQNYAQRVKQFEEEFGRKLTKAEDDRLQRQIQNDMEKQRIGIAGGNLGLQREEFNYRRQQDKQPRYVQQDGQFYENRNGQLFGPITPINPNPIMRER